MDNVERHTHWEHVYSTTPAEAASWFQAEPVVSLALLHKSGLTRDSCLIDVGGGDSRLADRLVSEGLTCLTVLDVSESALERAKRRLGSQAVVVHWLAADVTADWSVPMQDFWHDRAVFHFLTDPTDRVGYVRHLRETLRPGGVMVIATFAPGGPPRCSGLPTERYSPDVLVGEFGSEFDLIEHTTEEHRTPSGGIQPFVYCVFRRLRQH